MKIEDARIGMKVRRKLGEIVYIIINICADGMVELSPAKYGSGTAHALIDDLTLVSYEPSIDIIKDILNAYKEVWDTVDRFSAAGYDMTTDELACLIQNHMAKRD